MLLSIACFDSTAPAAATDQQQPQKPWFLTTVTFPASTQSTDLGRDDDDVADDEEKVEIPIDASSLSRNPFWPFLFFQVAEITVQLALM